METRVTDVGHFVWSELTECLIQTLGCQWGLQILKNAQKMIVTWKETEVSLVVMFIRRHYRNRLAILLFVIIYRGFAQHSETMLTLICS